MSLSGFCYFLYGYDSRSNFDGTCQDVTWLWSRPSNLNQIGAICNSTEPLGNKVDSVALVSNSFLLLLVRHLLLLAMHLFLVAYVF